MEKKLQDMIIDHFFVRADHSPQQAGRSHKTQARTARIRISSLLSLSLSLSFDVNFCTGRLRGYSRGAEVCLWLSTCVCVVFPLKIDTDTGTTLLNFIKAKA